MTSSRNAGYLLAVAQPGLAQSQLEHLYPLYLIVPVACFSTFAITSDLQSGQCFAMSS